jgi:gluconate 2-dehydrogenase gamma chain
MAGVSQKANHGSDSMTTFISRRELLRCAGLAGAAAAVARAELLVRAEAPGAAPIQAPAAAARTPLEHLSASEADILDAIVARLIPADANGPGALEAGATRYIDRALGGALASSREAYRIGLTALDQYARASRGKPFRELDAADQDAVLIDVEDGRATGFAAGSAPFFALVRAHTLQGTLCDPFYGGNANFVGWDLIGYPGVRTLVTPDEQRLGADVPANHKSAYDTEMFAKP